MPEEEGLIRATKAIINELEITAGTFDFKDYPESTTTSLDFVIQHVENTLKLYEDTKTLLWTRLGSLIYSLKVLIKDMPKDNKEGRQKFLQIIIKLRDNLSSGAYYKKVDVEKLQNIIRRL